MRLWSLHPSLLDRAALIAGWREGLLAQAVLAGRTKGYKHHPQLQRFRATPEPLPVIAAWLVGLRDEATTRGYKFDGSRIIATPDLSASLPVTQGQLDHELAHLRAKVQQRQPEWEPHLTAALPHPLFHTVAGDIEPWERP